MGIEPFLLNKSQNGVEGLPSPGYKDVIALFRAPFRTTVQSPDKTVAVPTVENDIRQLTQLSAFTIHGTATPLDDQPGNEQFLIRYEIPAASKVQVLEQLGRLAIRESNLFPDLDHLATGIGAKFGF